MSEKVFDNAREVFRELFDTGQNYESRINDLTKEKLELSTKFEEMKQGMLHTVSCRKSHYINIFRFYIQFGYHQRIGGENTG